LINNYDYKILEPDSLSNNMIDCIHYLRKKKESEEQIAKYMVAILQLYKNNQMVEHGTINQK
jgi:hypothetical protein